MVHPDSAGRDDTVPHPLGAASVGSHLRQMMGLSTESDAEGPSRAPTEVGRSRGRPEGAGPCLQIGDYQILGEIGRGGMGIVYRAKQARLDRLVALKVIRAGAGASPENIERFHREARAAASVQHDNLVAVHDIGRHGDLHYFSMELIEGESLAHPLSRERPTHARSAQIIRDAARGMAAAHARGILHRDLKPANILVGKNDRVWVTDFGLVKQIGDDSSLTQSGAVFGTPLYMPPEQAMSDREKMGPTADVYSLGATLYQGLTGRPPYDPDPDPIRVLAKVATREPIRPRRIDPTIPADLETIVRVAMDRDPRRRYPDAGELAGDLDRFLANEPIRARPPGAFRRLVLWSRRRPAAAALAVVLGVFVLAGAAWAAQVALLRFQEAARLKRAAELRASAARLVDEGRFLEAVQEFDEATTLDGDGRREREDVVRELGRTAFDRAARSEEQPLHEILAVLGRLHEPGKRESADRQSLAWLSRFLDQILAIEKLDFDRFRWGLSALEEGRNEFQGRDLGWLPDATRDAWLERIAGSARILLRYALWLQDRDLFDRVTSLQGLPAEGIEKALSASVTFHLKLHRWERADSELRSPSERTIEFRGTVQCRELLRGRVAEYNLRDLQLVPGLYLVCIDYPQGIPVRFLLPVPEMARISIRVPIYEKREDIGLDLVPLPALAISCTDPLDAPHETSRGRLFQHLAEAYASLLPSTDFFAGRFEVTNAQLSRWCPERPGEGWAPTDWDAVAWSCKEGAMNLPVRGLTREEAREVARRATATLPESLRPHWRYELPSRTADQTGPLDRLRLPLYVSVWRDDRFERHPLSTVLDPPALPSKDRPDPVGSSSADIDWNGCHDLAGSVSEWTGDDLAPSMPGHVWGGNFQGPGRAEQALLLGPSEARGDVGMRLVLVPTHWQSPPGYAAGSLDAWKEINLRVVELARPTHSADASPDPEAAWELLQKILPEAQGHRASLHNEVVLALIRCDWRRARERSAALQDGDDVVYGLWLQVLAGFLEARFGEGEPSLAQVIPALDRLLERDARSIAVRTFRAYARLFEGQVPEALADLRIAIPALYRVFRFERHLGLLEYDEALEAARKDIKILEHFLARRYHESMDLPGLGPEYVPIDYEMVSSSVPIAGSQSEAWKERLARAFPDLRNIGALMELARKMGAEPGKELQEIARIASFLAQVYGITPEIQRAKDLARAAALFGKGLADPHRALGIIALHYRERDEAQAAFESALEVERSDAESLLGLAWIGITDPGGPRVEQARQILARASDAGVAQAGLYRGILEMEGGDLEAAMRFLLEYQGAQPEDAAALIYLGEAARRAGFPDLAARHWGEAGERDPAYRRLAVHLAKR
ncbi:MAG: protein kinase [Planctomycetes bacterium]|nr:protein kinase [Planctomycetota bacterium]